MTIITPMSQLSDYYPARIGHNKTVHFARNYKGENSAHRVLCGSGDIGVGSRKRSTRPVQTSDPVTCKKCLRKMAEMEAAQQQAAQIETPAVENKFKDTSGEKSSRQQYKEAWRLYRQYRSISAFRHQLPKGSIVHLDKQAWNDFKRHPMASAILKTIE